MDFKQFYKTINFDIDNEIRTVYQATQGDTKSRGLLVDLIVGGVKTPVTTETMKFFALKPDGTRVMTAGVKEGTGFRIDFTNQTFAVPGVLLCTLVLYGTNGEKIADRKFKMTVDSSIEDGAIISKDERGILDRAFDLASDIVPRLEALDVPLLENLEQEVITARGTEATLGARLDSTDQDYTQHKLDYTSFKNTNYINVLGVQNTQSEILDVATGNNLSFKTDGSVNFSSLPTNKKTNIIANHRYYMRINWRTGTNNNANILRAYHGQVIPNTTTLGTFTNDGLKSSIIFTSDSTDLVELYIRNNITGNYYFESAVMIDLNVAFGEGNTKTLDEVDKFLDEIEGSYFSNSLDFRKLNEINLNTINETLRNLDNANGNRKMRAVKTGSSLDIYIPSSKNNNYLHYKYSRYISGANKADTWKITAVDIANSDFVVVKETVASIEWEGVIREEYADNFLGGVHGYETTTYIDVLIDGVEIDVNGVDFNKEFVNELKIVNKSLLTSRVTDGKELFNRTKVSTWNNDYFIIENKWETLASVNIVTAYVGMMSLPRIVNGTDYVSFGRDNVNYIKKDVNSTDFQGTADMKNGATIYELWGATSGYYYKIELEADFEQYPTERSGLVNSQENIIKTYYDLTYPSKQFEVGDELKAKATYTIRI